ncbi:MAG: arylesterase [Xanthobacteraceae bacterium]
MSFMRLNGQRPSSSTRTRSYGWGFAWLQIAAVALCGATFITGAQPANAEPPVKVVALGDSLTAGYGLPEKDGFVPRLQAALTAKGIAAAVTNAGVSGDTAADGLARLSWSVPEGTDAVIVELGANDMLRGLSPAITRDRLDAILHQLSQRHIAILLCGMRSAPNLGADYGHAFETIYPDLAAKYGAMLYPFFLDGVAGNLSLTQSDGLHPNAAGVGVIVERILPKVEELIARVRSQRPS